VPDFERAPFKDLNNISESVFRCVTLWVKKQYQIKLFQICKYKYCEDHQAKYENSIQPSDAN
jgi:hypothetical protein